MTDSLQNLAMRMAESDRQERQWLNDEAVELHQLITAIALCHGPLRVHDMYIHEAKKDSVRLTVREDKDNRCHVIEAKRKNHYPCSNCGRDMSHLIDWDVFIVGKQYCSVQCADSGRDEEY